ncbi:unnamed protein product [Paramecium octaurelia]|uniref:WD40-repeat-containing domain n=1 Tax=Paramecium octaurelia TaxID=43137 RepID=A0A8S1YKD1_PAROT|nr:unnamed protein product [Paramecium octaurelia]
MESRLIIAQNKNRLEECIQGVQQELNLSFSRIDAFLDQLHLVPYLPVAHNIINDCPNLTQITLYSIENFAYQLIQQVEPILKKTMHKQLQQNQQKFIEISQSDKNTKDNNQQLHPIIQDNQNQSNSNPFSYNLIQNNSIQQREWCKAIAFNKDNSIVLAGCGHNINVFEFKQEYLKLIQLLSEHNNFVTTLNFMKKSTQFISGSADKQIIIWSMDLHSQWICQYKLIEHSNYINCLILNNNEDQIISGSSDMTIKFWIKQNQWTCSQTIKDHMHYIVGLSLNEKQDRVISCGIDRLILIIEHQQKDQKWIVIQRISVEHHGYQLCFINDNVFTFQPKGKEYMFVYEINIKNKQYSQTNQIDVKSHSDSCQYWFAQQYLNRNNGKNVNLIRRNQNGHFITQQSIQFENYNIFGSVSEDGEYLMTWDEKSEKIQIRRYSQLL